MCFCHSEIALSCFVFDECQLWYCQCQEPLTPDPNRHPITPLKWIKCYVSTLHLVSDHIHWLLEWQGLCVFVLVYLQMRGWVGCAVRPVHLFFCYCVLCQCFNPLMWVSTRGFRSLRLTTLWRKRLLHSSVTSGLSWRIASLGLSVLWQRGIFRSQLFLRVVGLRGRSAEA